MIFTDHVRNPDPADFNRVLDALTVVLRKRLRKKGLFTQKPAYLDYPQHSTWNDTEALKEISYDFYGECFVIQRNSLLGFLANNPDVEGMIVRNVDNFIFNRQSKSDPIGYKSVKNCKNALVALESLGIVILEEGKGGKTIRIATAEEKAGDHRVDSNIAEFVHKYPGWGLGSRVVARISKKGTAFVTKLIIDYFAAGANVFRSKDLELAVKDKVKSCLKIESFDEEIHSKGNTVENTGQTIFSELFDLDCVRRKIAGSRNSSTRVDLSAMLESLMDQYRESGDFNLAEMANKRGLPTSTHHDQWKRLRGFFHECAKVQIRMIRK